MAILSRRASLVLLVLVLTAMAVAVAWLVTANSSHVATESAGPPGKSARAHEAPVLELAAAKHDGERALSTSVEISALKPAYPADTLWVEGRVVFPDGTPADERAFVVARGRRFLGEEEHRCELDAIGGFRAPFAPGSKKGALAVFGRYLHSTVAVGVDPSAPPPDLVLPAALGGCLRLQFVPTALAAARGADFTSAGVFALQAQYGSNRWPLSRFAVPDASGTVELGGLTAGATWSALVEMRGFVVESFDPVRVEAGRVHEVSTRLIVAPRFVGSVQDERGAPLPGALLHLAYGGNRRQYASADGDGRFDFYSDGAGSIALIASHRGYGDVVLGPWDAFEGFESTPLAIVLDPGLTIAGVVRWPDGEPASGASVAIAVPGSSTFQEFVETGSDGTFRLGGLEAGNFVATASAARAEHDASKGKADTAKWSARIESVPAGGAELELVLRPGHTLRGRAVDDVGEAVRQFRIEIVPAGPDVTARSRMRERFLGRDGLFEFHGVPDGTWEVRALRSPRGDDDRVRIELPRDADRELVFELVRNVIVSGRVLDPAGAPVARAEVYARSSGPEESQAKSTSRADGVFRIEDAPSGKLRLRASCAGFADSLPVDIDVPAGASREGLDLVVRRGATIVGCVRDAEDRPRPSVQVQCRVSDSQDWIPNATTDARGGYRFENVAPGLATLSLGAPRDELDYSVRATVSVTEGASVRVDLGGRPQGALRVRGTVRAGAPVADARIHFRRASRPEDDTALRGARTSSDGSYEVLLVEPGLYYVHLDVFERAHVLQQHEIVGSDAVLDIDLGTARVRGRVVDAEGRPLSGIDVGITTRSTLEEPAMSCSANATSTNDGSFELGPLLPSTYRLGADPGSRRGGAGRDLAEGAIDGLVVGKDALVDGIELRLGRGGSIVVVVRDAAGELATKARVTTTRAGFMTRSERTDARGEARIDGLSAGSYLIRATTSAGVEREPVLVSVSSGETARAVIELVPGGHLVVRTLDRDGSALPIDGRNSVWIEDSNGARWDGPFWFDATTGAVDHGLLRPGRYVVRAQFERGLVSAEAFVHAGGTIEVTLREPE